MDECKYQYDVSELAKAFTYMDIERLDMGDSHEEMVEYLCEKAGIGFDGELSDEDKYYYEKKSVEAYERMIKDGSIQDLIESIIDENYDNFDYLQRVMVYSETKYNDIKEHPTVKAICTIDNYIQNINNEEICSKEHCSKMTEIKEKILAVDIELCYVGNTLGHSYFRYLNPEYYFHSNDAFTVGHILSEDELERKLGEYTIHAEVLSKFRKSGGDQGYTIAFDRAGEDIAAHIYTYTKTYEPFYMEHKDTGCEMTIDTTNIEESAKELANKINELTENTFATGLESKNSLQTEQQADTVLEKLKGLYLSNDVVMSEFLRSDECKDLSPEMKMALLKWSGDDLFMTVDKNNEVILKSKPAMQLNDTSFLSCRSTETEELIQLRQEKEVAERVVQRKKKGR